MVVGCRGFGFCESEGISCRLSEVHFKLAWIVRYMLILFCCCLVILTE